MSTRKHLSIKKRVFYHKINQEWGKQVNFTFKTMYSVDSRLYDFLGIYILVIYRSKLLTKYYLEKKVIGNIGNFLEYIWALKLTIIYVSYMPKTVVITFKLNKKHTILYQSPVRLSYLNKN